MDQRVDIERQIREHEAALAQEGLPAAVRASIEAGLARLRAMAAGAAPGPIGASAEINMHGGRVDGPVVALNSGVILAFYGAQPPEDAEDKLRNYLESLIGQYDPLRLSQLLERPMTGGERSAAPHMSLRKVFTTLATDHRLMGETFDLPKKHVLDLLDAGDPRAVLPGDVRLLTLEHGVVPGQDSQGRRLQARIESSGAIHGSLSAGWKTARREVSLWEDDMPVKGTWYRPEIAVEAVGRQRRLVLLGAPGSGKSTVLRYLTVTLAEALLEGRMSLDLEGWDGPQLPPVPLFLSLGKLAERLDDDPDGDFAALINALLQSVEGGGLREGLSATVLKAWRSGGALLCLDGLDEVPSNVERTRRGPLSRRARIAAAIQRLAEHVGASRIVVTSRTRPYDESAAWQLGQGWARREIGPFTFGQVRWFAAEWYGQTCAGVDAHLSAEDAEQRAKRLADALELRTDLHELTESPLLLTMIALLDYRGQRLPDSRADVYDELVALLLERWELVRSETTGRYETFGQRFGLPDLNVDRIRPTIYEIAFEAHQQAVDGRGVLASEAVYEKLDRFFADQLRQTDAYRHAEYIQGPARDLSERFLALLVRETGLLQPEGDASFILPHLTFEEYLAACHLARQESVDLVYKLWQASPGRWREVVLLYVGRLLKQEKFGQVCDWLRLLTRPSIALESGQSVSKTPSQHQSDLLLAADCYNEVGRGDKLPGQNALDVFEIDDKLRDGLVTLVTHPVPEMALPQRIQAGDELARLGDPRYPVIPEEWCDHLRSRNQGFGAPDGYWCYVRPGSYPIGGWGKDGKPHTVSLKEFWIARFPVTVAQFAPFVAVGYAPDAERWWTREGWKWKESRDRTQPWRWNNEDFTHPNQPVIGVTWYEAMAWANWCSEQIEGLPRGYTVRLPTEAEWEAAAAFGEKISLADRREYPWGGDDLTIEHAIFNEAKLGRTAPVGVCPSSAAACGALDMVGNVWEWTASRYRDYPAKADDFAKDFTPDEWDVPERGGSWYNNRTNVRCAARVRTLPVVDDDDLGFRVVVAPSARTF